MKLLLVNPNISEPVTAAMLARARSVAPDGVIVDAVTAPFGALYVANRAEVAIAAHAVLEVLASHAGGYDGAIVSAFGDPGLAAARELHDIPVVGIAESALLTAWMLGRRISIVCMTPRLRTWYRECAREHDLAARVVAVRALDVPVTDIARARHDLAAPLRDLCLRSVEEDEAEVIILGGGPLAGLAADLAAEVPVPLLDGVDCAVGQLHALVRLATRVPGAGSFARPEGKPVKGLSAALAARMLGD